MGPTSYVTLERTRPGDIHPLPKPFLKLTPWHPAADWTDPEYPRSSPPVQGSFSPKELVASIQAVMRRVTPTSKEEPIEFNWLKLEPVSHRVTTNDSPLDMGPTEFKWLHFLMTQGSRLPDRRPGWVPTDGIRSRRAFAVCAGSDSFRPSPI